MKEKNQIPFNKPFIAGQELEYIRQAVLDNGHLSGDGPFTKLCHQWFVDHLDCQAAFLTHSGTDALEMAAILCDLEPGDEVIMPSFTFASTANAFVLQKGVPVFVDIRPDTLTIDASLIEEAISPRTKAIVPVHYAGIACEMTTIMALARRHNLLVVEDAAQALLSTYKDSYLGTVGHLGCISFHETKNIISGEGGALLVNETRLQERAEIIRDKGTNRGKFFRGEVDRYTWVDIGSSFLPSELMAAFLYAQLEKAQEIIAARCEIFKAYYTLLQPLQAKGQVKLPDVPVACGNNSHIFFIITRTLDERTRLIRKLRDDGILAVFHYVPLHSSPAGLRYGRQSGRMTVTDDYHNRILRLPMYFGMSVEEIDRVTGTILDFYRKS